jgi:putative glycerol-1-phosphate prenyltransferase
MKSYERLIEIKKNRGAGYCVLIDPDKIDPAQIPAFIESATEAGVDVFLIGGSLLFSNEFDATIALIKQHTTVPVIIFPGNVNQVSPSADAMLFLSLISGRNPDMLIGNHVIAAPIIKRIGLETIPTGYMLIDGGNVTSVEFMSNTHPIPRNKPDIAVAHALAGEMLGLRMLYLEAGSGAAQSIPDSTIQKISKYCSLPLIVGGGIRTPEDAHNKVGAGASFIVTGTVIEEQTQSSLLRAFAEAIHQS